jgi:hypothetical protein
LSVGALHIVCFCISDAEDQVEGRLGPLEVCFQFDINTNVGTLIIDQDRLGVCFFLLVILAGIQKNMCKYFLTKTIFGHRSLTGS